MKEFIEKLIGRLEENIFVAELHGFGWDGQRVSNLLCLGDVKDISEQLAEEYKHCALCYLRSPCEYQNENAELPASEFADSDGWIPCSERSPEEKEQERMVFDPITFAEIDVERYMASDLVNVTVRHYDSDDLFVSDDCTVDGKWVNYDGEEYEVIAWQPLPPAYQPKGE